MSDVIHSQHQKTKTTKRKKKFINSSPTKRVECNNKIHSSRSVHKKWWLFKAFRLLCKMQMCKLCVLWKCYKQCTNWNETCKQTDTIVEINSNVTVKKSKHEWLRRLKHIFFDQFTNSISRSNSLVDPMYMTSSRWH